MSQNKFILSDKEKIGDGMTVPPGYFAAFNRRMQEMLPANPDAENGTETSQPARGWWNAWRPYIYMAAMFAGVWCMTQMFSLMKTNGSSYSLDTNPVMTAALSNNDFYEDYVITHADDYDILDNLYEEGFELAQYQF